MLFTLVGMAVCLINNYVDRVNLGIPSTMASPILSRWREPTNLKGGRPHLGLF
jgi:hypothetical protein